MKKKYLYLGATAIFTFIGCTTEQTIVAVLMVPISIISVGAFLELDNAKE